jgi:hypothetical protein
MIQTGILSRPQHEICEVDRFANSVVAAEQPTGIQFKAFVVGLRPTQVEQAFALLGRDGY